MRGSNYVSIKALQEDEPVCSVSQIVMSQCRELAKASRIWSLAGMISLLIYWPHEIQTSWDISSIIKLDVRKGRFVQLRYAISNEGLLRWQSKQQNLTFLRNSTDWEEESFVTPFTSLPNMKVVHQRNDVMAGSRPHNNAGSFTFKAFLMDFWEGPTLLILLWFCEDSLEVKSSQYILCLLYTSDAADE